MNQFDSRAIPNAERLRTALGTSISYSALADDGSVMAGFPKALDAIIRQESVMRTYDDDGDVVTETIKAALPTEAVSPKIGDRLTVGTGEYSVVDIEIRGPALTTVTAERTYPVRVGARQGFLR